MLALQFSWAMNSTAPVKAPLLAHVVAVRMRVDDHNHGFGRDRFDLLQNARAVVSVFGIHDDDALLGDEGRSVTASVAAGDHVQVVFYFLNFELRRLTLLRLLSRDRHRDRAGEQKP